MRKSIILTIIAVLALQVQALDVNNTAGLLSTQVTDLNVTSLTISGSMNAEDFYFIADKLHHLTTVDLATVDVEPYHCSDRHYWQQDFQAGELPAGTFAGKKVTRVVLPASLKLIGRGAFAGCGVLSSIALPASLDSIGDYAFAACTSLESVTLPASVITVGRGAFMRCSSLTTIEVEPSSRLSKMDATALMDCPSLTTIKLGSALQSVGERSLAGTGVKQLDLTGSKGLKSIGDWAMVLTPVTEAKLPTSINTIGQGAFLYDTDLANITLGGNVSQINDFMLAGTGLETINLKGVSALGDYALYNNSRLSVIELPASMTWLGTRAMAGMTGMTAISSDATIVPALGENVWEGVDQPKVTLTVPASSLSLYQEADQWKEFLIESGWLRGDVNLDGEVNISDVNLVVKIILGTTYDEGTMMRADVNEDGEVNISDVNMLIRIILTGSSKSPAIVNVNDQLHLDDVAMRPGEERTLTITLDNAADYEALQCDITLPAGLTLVNTTWDRNHAGETSETGESTSRTVLYSSQRVKFANDGAVLHITVRADDALAAEGEILVSNIVLADEGDTSRYAANCSARVTNSSGIEDLNFIADRVWVDGHTLCIETRHEGTAQVTSINGTQRPMPLTTGVNRQELEVGFYVVVLNGKSHKIAIK